MKLRFLTYSGMWINHGEGLDRDEARQDAADLLKFARRTGCEVQTLDKGHRWEIQTQANIDGIAITDSDGYLLLEEEPEPEYDDDTDGEEEAHWHAQRVAYGLVEDD